MQVVRGVNSLRSVLKPHVNGAQKIGFVATMGALHEGHMVLVDAAKKDTDVVVASIFVNPTQFNESSDFEKYPRTEARDIALLEESGCDVVYIPQQEEVYPVDQPRLIDYRDSELFGKYEGTHRPGHFEGVVTVVMRLFDHITPTHAYFGLKDFQQYLVIKRATEYFKRPIEVIGVATKRADSGLALSSRNFRLNEGEQEKASVIYTVLNDIKHTPVTTGLAAIKEEGVQKIESAGLTIDYLDICTLPSLDPVAHWEAGKEYIAVCAAFSGSVRLIDNLLFTKPNVF